MDMDIKAGEICEADKQLKEMTDHIALAIGCILSVVVQQANGYDEYSDEYIIKLYQSLIKLIEIHSTIV